MVIDYERAWNELAAHIASKPQHGREATLIEMTRIASDHTVAAGELSRTLRLYGIEVERTRADHTEDRLGTLTFERGTPSLSDDDLAGHHRPGGHDAGSSNNGAGREQRDAARCG